MFCSRGYCSCLPHLCLQEPETEAANGDSSDKQSAQAAEPAKEAVKGLPSLKPKPKGGKKEKEGVADQAEAASPQKAAGAAK